MSLKSKFALGVLAWLVLITGLHAWLNVNWGAVLNDYQPRRNEKSPLLISPSLASSPAR